MVSAREELTGWLPWYVYLPQTRSATESAGRWQIVTQSSPGSHKLVPGSLRLRQRRPRSGLSTASPLHQPATAACTSLTSRSREHNSRGHASRQRSSRGSSSPSGLRVRDVPPLGDDRARHMIRFRDPRGEDQSHPTRERCLT